MSVLDRDDIERIAARVAELLHDRPPPFARYADAATVARLLAVDRDWVYAHARELGAIRLGGPQGRLRFDIDQLHRSLDASRDPAPRSAVGGAAKATGDRGGVELTSPSRQTRRRRRRPRHRR